MPAALFRKLSRKTRAYIMLAMFVVLSMAAISLTYTTYSVATGKISFTVRDIGEASDSCEQELTDLYGNNILSKSYDHGSSRYDQRLRRYKVWYRFTLRSPTEQGTMVIEDKMIVCEIREFLGYVSSFQVYDL